PDPVIVIPAVDEDVAHRVRGAGGGWQRVAEHWLIEVDDPDPSRRELRVEVRFVPGDVADLNHQRILAESAGQVAQPFAIPFIVPEGPGKLQQDRAQLPRCGESIEAGANRVDVLSRPRRVALVREVPPQLRREAELVLLANALRPAARDLGGSGPVERGVDLDGLEIARQLAQRVKALG